MSIVSVGSVFSEVVFVLEFLRSGLDSCVNCFGTVGHFSHFFQNYGIVHCFVGIFAPGEGSVVFAEYGGYCFGVFSHGLEFIYDKMSCIFLIGVFDFFFGQAAQAGNLSVNVIRMGGSVAGNASTCWAQLVA